MIHQIPNNGKLHIYVGSPGCLNLHTPILLQIADTLMYSGNRLKVKSIKSMQVSSYHPNNRYYELIFETLPV